MGWKGGSGICSPPWCWAITTMSWTKLSRIFNNFFTYHACHESWVLPFQILRFGVIHTQLIWRSNFWITFNDSCTLCLLYFSSADSLSFRATFNYFNNLTLHLWKKNTAKYTSSITPLPLSLIMRIYDIATVTLHLQRFPSLLKTHSSLFTGMLV